MKINKTIEIAINSHINMERTVAYTFMAMSSWFETTPFKGFAKTCLKKSEREEEHALQLQSYLKNRIGIVELLPIIEPKTDYQSPLEAFQKALEEKYALTASSHKLYAQAAKERDYQTQEYLHAFFQMQIQEEKHLQDFVDKLNLAKDNPDALIHLDYKEEVAYSTKK